MNCKNCGQIIDAKFCSHCGQNSKVDRITLTNFITELSDSLIQVNRGLLFTIKELTIRPGYSIKDYIKGKRKNYFKPIAYALALSTVYFLISKLTDDSTFLVDLLEGFNNGFTDSGARNTELPNKLLLAANWFTNNFAYAAILLIPLHALATYLAFFKSGFNYLEHIVLNSYIVGQQAIIYSIFILISQVFKVDFLDLIDFIILVLYAFWVFWQFFSEESRKYVILRSMLAYILKLIIILILLPLVFIGLGFL